MTDTLKQAAEVLTREQIEIVRSVYKRHFSDCERLDAVCDMALQSLSPPADRKAVIEECAAICDYTAGMYRRCGDAAPYKSQTQNIQQWQMQVAEQCAKSIRALAGAGGGKGT